MWSGPMPVLSLTLCIALSVGPGLVSGRAAEASPPGGEAAVAGPSVPAGWLTATPPFVAIAAGAVDRYPLHLDGPGLVVLDVDQHGIDLRIALEAPGGAVVAVADGPGGRWSRESLAALTDGGGDFVVDIRPTAGETGEGRYQVFLQTLRPRQPGDDERLRVERRIGEAYQARHTAAPVALDRAIATLEEAVDWLRERRETLREATLLHELADACLENDRPEAALDHLVRERELQRGRGDRVGEAIALTGEASVLANLMRPDDALAAAKAALALVSAEHEPDVVASASNVIALIYVRFLGRLSDAVPLLRTAVALHLRAGNLRDEANSLTNLGVALRATGSESGCPAVMEAANTAEAIRFSRPGLKISLGNCLRLAGRFGAAMASLQDARRQAEDEGNATVAAAALVHIGSILAELGEYPRAQAAFEQALPHLDSAEFRITAEIHLGWLAEAQGDAESSLHRFENLLAEYGDQLTATNRIKIEKGIGSALADLGHTDEALARFQAMLRLYDTSESRLGEAEVWRQIGSLRRRKGDLDGAREALHRSLAAAGDNVSQAGATYQEMARLDAAAGRVDEGIENIRKAIEMREELRSSVAPATLRASYLARWRDDFSLWIDLILRSSADGGAGAVERAFEVSERAHARTLQELLLEAGDTESEAPPALAAEQRQLTARLNDLVHRLTVSSPNRAQVARLEDEIHQVEAKLGELEWRVRRPALEKGPRDPLSAHAVRRRLGTEEALLEYALGKKRSFLFVVRRDSLDVYPLPPAEELAAGVSAVRGGLQSPDRALWRHLIRSSADLYRQLVAPAEARLAGVRRLIVVPDRELFYLPFETLLAGVPADLTDPSELAPHYLLTRWEVGYAPSATVMAQLQDLDRAPHSAAAPSLVAFADSRGGEGNGTVAQKRSAPEPSNDWGALPGARDEVRAIASLFPDDRVRVFEGRDATREEVRSAGRGRWLHFAVHGDLDAEHPSLSGLILADGKLYARQIHDLHLDADLVVLSACQTGLGQQVWGEELIGLSRAFFYSGVPTVVMSLWKVADRSTAPLMVAMYRGLLAGEAPITALSRAKRSFLTADGEWIHPYFWAPFVVFGAPDGERGNDRGADAPTLLGMSESPLLGTRP